VVVGGFLFGCVLYDVDVEYEVKSTGGGPYDEVGGSSKWSVSRLFDGCSWSGRFSCCDSE